MTTDGRTHQITPRQPGEKPAKRCNGPAHNGDFLPVEDFPVRNQKDRQGNWYRAARCFECNRAYGRELYQKKHPTAAQPDHAPAAPSAPVMAPPLPPPRENGSRGEGLACTAAGRRIVRAFMSRYWLALYDEDNTRYVEPALPDRVQQLRAAGVLAEGLEVGGRI